MPRKQDTATLEDIVQDVAESAKTKPTDQVTYLRQQVRSLTGEIGQLSKKLGEQREMAELVASAVVAAEPFKPFKFEQAGKGATEVSAVLKLGDWHIGEVIDDNQVEGFNQYNWSIAQSRAFSITDSFLKWVNVQRKSYRIDQCHIFCEGDFCSGDIHYELQSTNEFPLPVQTAKAGMLLGEVIRRVASHFKRALVPMVAADNHSRLVKKPQAKQKSTNSMGHLVYVVAQSACERLNNAKFITTEGAKLLVDVNGFRVLSEHGDSIKGALGFPYYGFGRAVGREATKRMNTDLGFHYHSIQHFHVPAIIPAQGSVPTLVGGSLCGTSEFDHICGRHAPPSQVAYLMHPKHGLFNWVPFLG